MAIENTEHNVNALLNGGNVQNQTSNNAKITHRKSYYGNSYDPEEHIYMSGHRETDHYVLTAADDNFAFYLNYPVYKIDSIDKDHYFFDTITGKVLTHLDGIEYSKVLFDMSDASNYKKLKTPELSKLDGAFEILEFGKEYTVTHV